jgi:alpha-L-fucosidase 2
MRQSAKTPSPEELAEIQKKIREREYPPQDLYRYELHEPAESFPDCFLLGTGRMGQAVMSQPDKEKILLSHAEFFSGDGKMPPAEPDAPEAFQAARTAAQEGRWSDMSASIERFMGKRGNYGTNLPVGTLEIDHHFDDEEITAYSRQLDMSNKSVRCEFLHNGKKHVRAAFISSLDDMFCLVEEDEAPMHVTLRVTGEHMTCQAHKHKLFFTAQALETLHSDGTCGVTLQGVLQLTIKDGQCIASGDTLELVDVHHWELRLKMETDFGKPLKAPKFSRDPMVLSFFTQLLLRNENFQDTYVQLGEDRTSERLYHFGRYLVASGSQRQSPMAMNLQGVWNDNVACRIGWTCDMHLDVNTQMNYWITEAGNLSSCHEPLFRWMEEYLIPMGRIAAKQHYGMPGWVGELVANAWGYAEPYWNRSLAPCPACGFWLALHIMEHYRTTQDQAFLKDHGFPMLDGAVDFILSYVFKDENGIYQSGPSISPENAFMTEEGKQYASLSPTYEISLIRGVLQDWLEADDALSGKHPERRAQIQEVLAHLPPIRVTDGIIAEWPHEYPQKDPQHRHMSHLIGLYPLRQIDPEKTPALADAAKETIRRRLDPYDNWEDTGWARNMLILYSARLQDGEQAYFHLQELEKNLMRPSMLVMHPSTRGASSFAPVWELDGNTGVAMAISEMLMQCHDGVIHLLPALPSAWKDGKFRRFRSHGGITVSADWKDGKPTKVVMKADKPCTAVLRWKNVIKTIRVETTDTVIENWEDESHE